MLRLRAFRPTNDKIVKIQMHPTHPWLVTADASDHVSVWNWEHRQVFLLVKSFRYFTFCLLDWQICFGRQIIYELKPGGVDERRLVGAKLEKLAEGESGKCAYCYYLIGVSVASTISTTMIQSQTSGIGYMLHLKLIHFLLTVILLWISFFTRAWDWLHGITLGW